MLKPAFLYKEEIEQKMTEQLYTDNFFYYTGDPYDTEPFQLENCRRRFDYAIVDDMENVIGYLSYQINERGDSARHFGLFSFDPGNFLLGVDVKKKLKELITTFHRIEWRMISGNPIKEVYDWVCKKYGGHRVELHDVCVDIHQQYHDLYIYEIINKEDKNNK